MRAAGKALPLYLIVALGTVPGIWAGAAEAADVEEDEASAEESATPKIYKWIDEHGIAHYTTDFKRIPDDLRDRVDKLGPPDAALTRTPVDASAPPRQTPSAPEAKHGEQWAVRDRSFEHPEATWDEGDPYAEISAPAALAEDEVFESEAEQEDRRQQREDLDERIASLQTDIAADEEALKVLIAIPVPEGGGPLAMAENPEFREIADRLPKLLADLRALEDERAQLEAP